MVGCAARLPDAGLLTKPSCYESNADLGAQIPMPSQELPPSNIFKLHYMYPEDLRRRHLQGRLLVRLKVAETGKVVSAELLRVDAPPPVEAAACNLLRELQYDMSKPPFDSVDSRTFLLGIRYCLGSCIHVPAYPGFEKNEISITIGLQS